MSFLGKKLAGGSFRISKNNMLAHMWHLNICEKPKFFFLRFFKFIFREGKGGRKRGRETSMCGFYLSAPYWRPGIQPRHVSWLGIELATLWFVVRHSIHWATPARAKNPDFFVLFVLFLISLYKQFPPSPTTPLK